MPPLPKKLNKNEQRITPKVIKWFTENFPISCAVEIKYGKNKAKPHQLAHLTKVSQGMYTHKFSDFGRIRQPFDFILLKDAVGIICTCDDKVCYFEQVGGGVTGNFRI